MKKDIKEQKMEQLGNELIEQNGIVCHVKDNEFRMVAAEHAYMLLGMLLGLADLDYYNPILVRIRDRQVEMFGDWAITSPNKFFYKFPEVTNE